MKNKTRSEAAKKWRNATLKDREAKWIQWLMLHNATIAYVSGYCGYKQKCLHVCLIDGCEFFASPEGIHREFSHYGMFSCPECSKAKSQIAGKDDAQRRLNDAGSPVEILEWHGRTSKDSVFKCPNGHIYNNSYDNVRHCLQNGDRGNYWCCPVCFKEKRREKCIGKINCLLQGAGATPLTRFEIEIPGQSDDYYSSTFSCGHTEIRRIGKWFDKIRIIHPTYSPFCQMCNCGNTRMAQRIFIDALQEKTGHAIIVEFPLENQNLKIDAFDADALVAYEWDGVFHHDKIQINRDSRKDSYLKSIGIKLVRIDAAKEEFTSITCIEDKISYINSVVDAL